MGHRERPIVLLVDEHDDSAAMYAIGLRAMGFEPVTASTAEQGFADACLFQPEVVVADVRLDRHVNLLRRLRADVRTRAAKINLTTQPSANVRDEARVTGYDCYLLKPCLPEVLAHVVRDVLRRPCGRPVRPGEAG